MKLHQNKSKTVFKTSFCWAGVSVSKKGICRIVLPQKNREAVENKIAVSSGTGIIDPVVQRKALKLLQNYFSGKRISCDLPLDIGTYTPFQKAVWKATLSIPSGETRSYAWIAAKIGKPNSYRAVGQALGANPIPIFIPCHRVVCSSGSLGGFAGGLDMKKKLLHLEQNYTSRKRTKKG
ncbi:MAG: methylated-DNA--[protein]-cysteine S-methyltransferase [Nitrospirota bacterium]